MELHLQRLQLGLNKLSFQLDRSILTFAKLSMIVKPLIGAQDGPIDELPPVLAHGDVAPHHGPPLKMIIAGSNDENE